jgi:AraC-like DNA-binding protein
MAKATSLIKAAKAVGFGSGVVQMQPGTQSRGTFREWILSITLQGATDYTLNGKHHLNRAGDMLLLSRNIHQHWRVPGPESWSVVYTIFEPRAHWLPWLDTILHHQPWRVAGQGTRDFFPAAESLKQVDTFRRSAHIPLANELALNALERAILLIAQALPDKPNRDTADPRITQALAWTVNHLDQPIALEDLAHACNTSRANFCRLFKRATSQAPMQYVDRLRMDRALELLSTTGLPIKQIAGMVGFDDPKYFAKRFKAIMGLPPTAFKAKP